MRLGRMLASATMMLLAAGPASAQETQMGRQDLDGDNDVASQCICDIAPDIVGIVFSNKPDALGGLKRGSTFFTEPMGGRSCNNICGQVASDPDHLTYRIRARITRPGRWAAGGDYFLVDGAVIEQFGPFRMD